jgi:hypothetical protein
MKKIICLLFSIFILGSTLFAQAPQAFKYQAVARTSSGTLVQNQVVSFRISIIPLNPSGTPVYQELQNVTTNNYGLASLEIGNGLATLGTFSFIDWSVGLMYMKVEFDPIGGTAYLDMGTTQLLSVPYAMYASEAELPLPYSGSADYSNNTDALFMITNTGYGATIMGKSTTTQGGKGVVGWANAETGYNYGVYGETYSPAGWGTYGGGPMVGVLGNATNSTYPNFGVKGVSDSNQGTGVYGQAGATSGTTYGVYGKVYSAGGYGVYGEGPFIGVSGTANITSGSSYGVIGRANSAGGIGVEGLNSTSGGTAVFGHYNYVSGNGVGIKGFSSSSTGYSGFFSGGKFYVDNYVGIGTANPSAGLDLVGSGFPSSFMYIEAPSAQDAGIRIYEGGTAKWHIFNSTGAGGLHIYNSGAATAIFCAQSTSNVGIGTTSPAYKLQVGNAGDGTQARANAWNLLSDERLKKDFTSLSDPLDMVTKMNGYYYYWNTGSDKSKQIGFSAQQIKKILPEVVSKGADGYLSIEYGKIAPLLVEAIKEQQVMIEKLQKEIEELKANK